MITPDGRFHSFGHNGHPSHPGWFQYSVYGPQGRGFLDQIIQKFQENGIATKLTTPIIPSADSVAICCRMEDRVKILRVLNPGVHFE